MPLKRRAKGTGSIFKKANGRYAFRYTDFCNLVRTQTLRYPNGMPITNRADAVKAANELLPQINRDSAISSRMEYLSRIAELKNLIPKNDLKIADVWDRYLNSASRPDSGERTLAFYQTAFEIFKNWLHKNHSEMIFVRQIDSEIANEFAMYYWRTGVSERTYNARICALKLIFKILLKNENPFVEIRHKTELQQSRKAFTPEQLKKIFAKLEEPDYYMLFKDEMRLMILIMLYTGCRGGDACTMQWKAVNLSNRSFVFIPRKTARHHPQAVHVPMAELLFYELQTLSFKRSDSEFVLPLVADRYLRNPSGISTDIGKLLKAAGIITQGSTEGLHRKRAVVEYSMHSFRHTFCSMAANAGIDLSVIRAMVGHTQTAMTEHYTHYSIEAKRRAIEALPMPLSEATPFTETRLEQLISQSNNDTLQKAGRFLSQILSPEQQRDLKVILLQSL